MTKKIVASFLLTIALYGDDSIDQKIKTNESILKNTQQTEAVTNVKIKELAKQIEDETSELEELEKDILSLNTQIEDKRDELEDAKKALDNLQKSSSDLKRDIKKNEESIVQTILENFSSTLALEISQSESFEEVINSEIYQLLLRESKDDIIRLNSSYLELTQNKKDNENQIEKIKKYLSIREREKEKLNNMLKSQSDKLSSYKQKHEQYQAELKKVIEQQNDLSNLLSNLNILKKVQDKKKEESDRKKKEELLALKKEKEKTTTTDNKGSKQSKSVREVQQNMENDIDLDIRMIGSSTEGVQIAKYTGEKTIAPLDSFSVVKKFGKYFDPVYKIELFNDSTVLKTKIPQAKVHSVLPGKVVYAKENSGMFENVVIIQHANGLHTVYSHLDEISPIKVGNWVVKGYVVGRVNDTLTFQAIKNNNHINPEELFK